MGLKMRQSGSQTGRATLHGLGRGEVSCVAGRAGWRAGLKKGTGHGPGYGESMLWMASKQFEN